MVCILDQLRSRIAGQGQELAGMTAFAAIGNAVVDIAQKPCWRCKTTGISVHVALGTNPQCRDMINFLAYGTDRNVIRITIVAALTLGSDIGVKECLCRLEWFTGGVANDAVLGRRDMFCRFSGADVTVVTGNTIVGNSRVAENCAGKASGREVTVHAVLVVRSGRYVIYGLSRDDDVVVAGRAVNRDTGMIVGAGSKGARGMAVPAIVGCDRHVRIQRRAGRQTGCIDAVMARIAAKRQHGRVGVVHAKRRGETPGVMAGTAISRGYWMSGHCRSLPGRVYTIGIVVAGFAA